MSEPKIETLRAVIDRIIPRDDFPSASDAGVDRFILALLNSDRAADAPWIDDGLMLLDAEAHAAAGVPFAEMSAAGQDALLKVIERGQCRTDWPFPAAQFFGLLVTLTAEGYYSDPANGGNRDAASWTMLGYDPGPNRP